jgi:signal transduction histidine kinase
VKTITSRIVLLIATAAVAPLLIYGYVSVNRLQTGTERSVHEGNLAVAQQVAERVAGYFENNRRVLGSIAAQIQNTQLEPWQQERILRNHVIDFREFKQITVFSAGGTPLASSRGTEQTLTLPKPLQGAVYIAPPVTDGDGFPSTIMAVPVDDRAQQWIVAEFSLEELWRAVDQIRVGSNGIAVLLDANGRLMAHGDADEKRLIAEGATRTPEQDLAAEMRREGAMTKYRTLSGSDGEGRLGAAARIRVPDWTVIIEQPERQALAVAHELRWQLQWSIALALLATVGFGWVWGRTFIRRIFALTTVTRALAAGDMEARVHLRGKDELRQLGDAFNSMADRLVELQEEIRKQERQAMFGRIAAGLVHDLSHPIQTIGNSCKLIQRIFDDAEYRATFRQTVERELATVKRVLDDLRNIAKPMPLERFSIDANEALLEAVETMTPHAETAGLTVRTELAHEPAYIEADLFALGRVHRNLILNAIQATAPGGLIVTATEVHADRVLIKVYDTGCGIPADRLHAIFDDFVTTKRRGLGLGLAISKKIVEQLGGRISVASEVGKGTTFVMDFPRAAAPPVALIAG